MKKETSKLALAIGALVMAGGAMAQSTPTATAGAAATIIAPLKLTKTADLNFGNIAPGNSDGTVVLTPGAVRTATDTDGPILPPTQSGIASAAAFDVVGQGAYTYAITLPLGVAAITLSANAGADTMTVGTFTVATGGTGTVVGTVGTLAAGAGNLKVGATLNVGATQTAGSYTGSFDVTVAYN